MKTNKILVAMLVLVCFSVLAGCSTESKSVTYENKKLQFKLNHPEDWKKEESESGVTFGDQVTFGMAVMTTEVPGVKELDDSFMQSFLTTYQSMPGFQQVSLDKTELGKIPASRFVFTGKQDDKDMKAMIINAIKDERLYMVLYMTPKDDYDNRMKQVEAALKSFEFTN